MLEARTSGFEILSSPVRRFRYDVSMIELNIKNTGVEKALSQLQQLLPKQYKFIVAVALTETARDVEFITKRAMKSDIDRPRDFTINSMYTTRATKNKLEASLQWRDFAGKGTAGGEYLKPIAEGTARPLKRSEYLLRRANVLPNGYFLVPGQDAKLDQYGNIPGSVYVQMISALRSFMEVGFLANRARLKEIKDGERGSWRKKQTPWFVIKPGDKSGFAPGIYQRLSSARKLIFAMVRQPKYSVTFPFERITRRAAIDNMPKQLYKAIELAINTAKPGRL